MTYPHPFFALQRAVEDFTSEMLAMHESEPQDDEERAEDKPSAWDLAMRELYGKFDALWDEHSVKLAAIATDELADKAA